MKRYNAILAVVVFEFRGRGDVPKQKAFSKWEQKLQPLDQSDPHCLFCRGIRQNIEQMAITTQIISIFKTGRIATEDPQEPMRHRSFSKGTTIK
jgi:hypothetical protein